MKRRDFLKGCGGVALASLFAPACRITAVDSDIPPVQRLMAPGGEGVREVTLGGQTMPTRVVELGQPLDIGSFHTARWSRLEVAIGLEEDAPRQDLRVTIDTPEGNVTRECSPEPGTFTTLTAQVGGLGGAARVTVKGATSAGQVVIGNPLVLTPQRTLQRPSVYLVTIDTLRADHMSAYGYHRKTTPVFDAHMGEGTLFERAYSAAPWTRPSYASLLTSLPPSVHMAVSKRVAHEGLIPGLEAIGPQFTTLAERFRDAGYLTLGLYTVGNLAPTFGFAQGFDQYGYIRESVKLPNGQREFRMELARYSAEAYAEQLARYADLPVFAFINIIDPHAPYRPPRDFYRGYLEPGHGDYKALEGYSIGAGCYKCEKKTVRREDLVAMYDGEVRYTDFQLGRIFGELRRSGRYDDSLVVLTADHGEELGDRGGWGHGQRLTDEQIRVPLWMRMRGRMPHGLVTTPVSQMALGPTILDLAGIGYEADGMWEPGLLPHVLDGAPAGPVYSEVLNHKLAPEAQDAMVYGGAKLIRGRMTGSYAFYDLGADPGERTNTADSAGEAGYRLNAALVAAQSRCAALRTRYANADFVPPDIHKDPALIQRLKDLGYL
jgi:arylsulfatase